MIQRSTILLFLLITYQLSAQSNLPVEISKKKPLDIYHKMIHVSSEKNILLFEAKEYISFNQFIQQISLDSFHQDHLSMVDHFGSDKSNYWMLLPIQLIDSDTLGLAIMVYGCQKDSIWVLDNRANITQRHQIPNYNFKKDFTGSVVSGALPGIGININKKDCYILINTRNYSYSKYNIPILFDAQYYTPWYFKTHLFKFIFFLFMTGIELGLILYFLMQFVLMKEKFILWYLLYVVAQMFPNLDYIHWAFSDFIPLPYSWFHFKVFHLCSIMICYLFFIKNILDGEIKLFNRSFNILIYLSLTIFIVDSILLLNEYDFWSGELYSIARSFVGLFSFLITALILFYQRNFKYSLLFIGTLCLTVSEIIGWIFFTEYRSYIINIGILLEYFFFSYLINYMVKLNEKDRQSTKNENQALIKKQKDLTQIIAQDIHDEVGSIITRFNLALELDKLKNVDKSQFQAITQYQSYVEKIREGLRDLVQIIDNNEYDYVAFKASVREIAYDYLVNTPMKLHIDMPEQSQSPLISYQIKRNLESVLKEALQNILKHSTASNVYIDLRLDNGMIAFNIEDDGIGIQTNTQSKSKGFTYMAQRIKKLNGTLNIISSGEQKGTKLMMLIPY